jgi:tetratricopeptide (TPR) repeat protein
VIRPIPRGSGPNLRFPTSARSSNQLADGNAETLSSTSNAGNAATVTSLAGAVIMQPQPSPPPKRRTLAIAGGALAIAAIATALGLATRSNEPPIIATPDPDPKPALFTPAVGLQAIADYREPKPSTVGNQRSEQVWLGAHESFDKACAQPGAPAMWCAGKYFALGELALIRDDVRGSIKHFEEATTVDPTWSTGHLGLANAHSHDRKVGPALAAARKAESLEPESWQPALASARAYIAVNKVDDALIEYRRAMSKSPPNNAVMLSEIALAFHFARKDDEAQKLAAQASAIHASLVPISVLHAELALEVDDGAKALELAERALAVSPKNGAALIARGDALVLLGRRGEAIAVYRHALKLRGGMNILAVSDARLREIEEALAKDELPAPRSTTRSPATENETSIVPGTPPRSGSTISPGGTAPRSGPTRVPGDDRSPTAGSPGGGGRSPATGTPRGRPASDAVAPAARTPSTDHDSSSSGATAERSPPSTNEPSRSGPSGNHSSSPRSPPSTRSPRSPPRENRPPPSRSPPRQDADL